MLFLAIINIGIQNNLVIRW